MSSETKTWIFLLVGVTIFFSFILGVVHLVQANQQAYIDKGMIWVPTIEGHWEYAKQPAESPAR
jgi:hypothetical protein